MFNMIDEFTHECLAIRVARRLKSIDVIDVLSDLFILRGVPGHVRSDNGPEFVARAVQEWIAAVGAKTAYIQPGNPWENGYVESFNARLRDELLDGEIFYTLREAKIVIESWRRHYNAIRPHASLGYRAPACRSSLGSRHSRKSFTCPSNGARKERINLRPEAYAASGAGPRDPDGADEQRCVQPGGRASSFAFPPFALSRGRA